MTPLYCGVTQGPAEIDVDFQFLVVWCRSLADYIACIADYVACLVNGYAHMAASLGAQWPDRADCCTRGGLVEASSTLVQILWM